MQFFQYLCGFVAFSKRVNKNIFKKAIDKLPQGQYDKRVDKEEQQALVGGKMLPRKWDSLV